MSEEEKNQKAEVLAQFLAEIETAKKSASAAKDAAIADFEQFRSSAALSKTALDTAAAELAQAKANVEAAKSTAIADIEKASAAVGTAKASAEAAAAEVDKLKTAIATAKGAIDADQKNSSADAAVIGGTKKDVEKLKAEVIVQRDALANEAATVAGHIADLQKSIKPLEGLLASLTEIKTNSETERDSVTKAVEAIQKAKGEFETLATQAQEKHQGLTSQYGALDETISEINGAYKDIADLKKLLLEDDGDKISIRTSINSLKDQIVEVLKETSQQRDNAQKALDEYREKTARENAEFVQSTATQFDSLHKKLEGEIRALLPSAGAAGLATTYYDAKSRYAWTSFAGKPGSDNSAKNGWVESLTFRLRSMFGYNPINLFSTGFFYSLFILPILGIVWIFLPLVRQLPNTKLDKFEISLVLVRFLIALPLAAISAFGIVSLTLYRRLYEEYNYKQRVMELYGSFQKEMSEGGTEEQKKALLQVMIDTVSDRSYLAKGSIEGKNDVDAPVQQEILSQLNSISSIVSNIAKVKT